MEPEQPMGDIFKTRFSEAKVTVKKRLKRWRICLGLQRKRKPYMAQSQGNRRKVKDNLTEEQKKKQ